MSLGLYLLAAAAASAAPAGATDAAIRAAIEAACHDYIDGQLAGNVSRVENVLHPDVVLRSVQTRTPHRPLELDVETRAMLLDATRKGVLKIPAEDWKSRCEILDVVGNAASVRMDEGGFVVYFHMGNFDGKWLVVDGFWVRGK